MLAHLTIRNLAIVEELTLDLGPGMNVLTGETGAGKSITPSSKRFLGNAYFLARITHRNIYEF